MPDPRSSSSLKASSLTDDQTNIQTYKRGSVSRSASDLQTLLFIPNTFCLAKLLRAADPRSDW